LCRWFDRRTEVKLELGSRGTTLAHGPAWIAGPRAVWPHRLPLLEPPQRWIDALITRDDAEMKTCVVYRNATCIFGSFSAMHKCSTLAVCRRRFPRTRYRPADQGYSAAFALAPHFGARRRRESPQLAHCRRLRGFVATRLFVAGYLPQAH